MRLRNALGALCGAGLLGMVACSSGPGGDEEGNARAESEAYVPSSPAWQGWESLSGGLITDPAIVAESPNRLAVFATGPDGAVYQRYYQYIQWVPTGGQWTYLGNGGHRLEAPVAVTFGGDHIELFARDEVTHHLMHQESVGHPVNNMPGWNAGGWEDLGGDLAPGKPTVVLSQPGNQANVFVTGSDGRAKTLAVHGYRSHGAWIDLSGGVLFEPGAASWGPNRLDVFAAGTDHGLYHRYSIDNGTSWWPSNGDWESVGGSIAATPAVTAWSANRLDIIATGMDASINHLAWNGSGWGTCPNNQSPCWMSVGAAAYSDPENGYAAPTAIVTGQYSLQLFIQGKDQALYTESLTGFDMNQNPTWSGFTRMTSCFRTAGAAAVTSRDNNTLDLVVTEYGANGSGQVWHTATTGGSLRFTGIGASAPPACPCGANGQMCCAEDGCNGVMGICTAFGTARTCQARSSTYRTPSETELAVPLFTQEEPNWCWAASEQMILNYLGTATSQCTLANKEGYVSKGVDCCSSQAVKDSCDHGGWPRFELWGMSSTGQQSSALSWADLTHEIDSGRPFNFSWKWPSGASHDMVVSGYKIVNGQQYVTLNDPSGRRYQLLYSQWVGEPGNFTFLYNEYGIHRN